MATLNRRKAVMARSMKLGHCVCDPKKPCPCDMLKTRNICLCAGERPPAPAGPVMLTRHVHKAGCASKVPQADLQRLLADMPPVTDPNVLLGAAAGDDAGVYRLDDRYALVQTVDVFTPCVDDAYLFGQIAAANSVSDIYAMGAVPRTALSILGFPIEELDGAVMTAMVRGGMDKLAEAGCSLIGGHSINEAEIKFGFAVTGILDTAAAVQRDRAEPGDVLVLTKPLGTGLISFAAQLDLASPADLEAAGNAMATLNRDAARLMLEHNAHACTDVTGFGLAGHLTAMIRGSGVDAILDLTRLPVFAGVRRCLDGDVIPGAVERNQEYAMAWVHLEDDAAERDAAILYDPQTSGGLLIALPERQAEALVAGMHALGHDATAIIGRIAEKPRPDADSRLIVTGPGLHHYVGKTDEEPLRMPAMDQPAAPAPAAESCCDNPPGATLAEGDSMELFSAFMKAANAPGLIDARAKKLMAIALSVAQRCEPCLKIHMRTALSLGISMAEIDEAANLAIAFGGCTAMMFYRDVKEQLKGARAQA